MLKRKSLKRLLALLIVFASSIMIVFSASAIDLSPEEVTPAPTLTAFDETGVRLSVLTYFSDRDSYLKNNIDQFTSAVPAMVRDEEAHRLALTNGNITLDLSTVTIDEIHCDINRAEITATELVRYSVDGVNHTETVAHKVTVFPDENDLPVVAGDEYIEEFSGFKSCSYVPPEVDMVAPLAAGSRYCIVEVAKGEVGYTPDSDGTTKYGRYAGSASGAWCASFVSWCAHQANISESVIARDPWAPNLRYSGEFFPSKSQGGSRTPQAGDLFFEGSSTTNISHVGIVASVDSSYIYVVDGNCNGKVASHTHALTSSSVVGYTRPKYASTGHNYVQHYNSTKHWMGCSNCPSTYSTTNHSYTKQSNSSGHWSKCACGYTTASAQHTASSSWSTDATYHWHACTVCSYQLSPAKHSYSSAWSYDGTYHWHKCTTCAHKQSTIKHSFKLSGGTYTCTTCGYKTTRVPGTQAMIPEKY